MKTTTKILSGMMALGMSIAVAQAGDSQRLVSHSHGTPRYQDTKETTETTVAIYSGDRMVVTSDSAEMEDTERRVIQSMGRSGFRMKTME